MELVEQRHGGRLRRGNPPPVGGWPGCGRPSSHVWVEKVRDAWASHARGELSVEGFQEAAADALFRSACRGDVDGSLRLVEWLLDRGLRDKPPAGFTGKETDLAAERLTELADDPRAAVMILDYAGV